eukprot:TRINITY_DN21_c0_g1::TRINITY_DN21_c0_g1_i1::g.14884::m.14884 TRINITY_DN21_c0_g1::TRINITY_DN21_c0_g1_i1::g.14884  ORF type:complete len:1250 (+),score=378.72,sp/Q5R6L5/CAND1_PONAB/40.08/0.0,TIP120/PF08623.5/2.3,TIP120/PF08623.5/2e+02,TIP120/PF08623.5/0.78,TIP120/PF08623.5/1e-46,HEAT_2/PF13646.1/3.2,HEAT_2/PF13646.1/8.4,HEAT_2/PF13646.1/2.8,HEAT_2/PF13646.1/3.4e+03,HEAT_2/PF13646.1/38,HEAT_2/PF13646.1/0.13,HEAT_2/PF13646.1/0.15,HEAT_2/PF13646.1/0.00035,HEAT_2/PF13646.1/0.00015,HEAT_2/PF13646.1/0.07
MAYPIQNILEKMVSVDRDFRYMASNDLFAILQKDNTSFDAETERRLCKNLVKQLSDISGEVQTVAKNCLGPLAKRIQIQQLEELVDSLCAKLQSTEEHERDTASLALKTVIEAIRADRSAKIAPRLAPRLAKAVAENDSLEVKVECLDIITLILIRYGHQVEQHHELILNSIFPQLSNSRQSVRKHTITALSSLSKVANDTIFKRLCEQIRAKLEQGKDFSTFAQAVVGISRAVGIRLGDHVDHFIPPLIQHAKISEDIESNSAMDETTEACLQALEALTLRCPRQVIPHVQEITSVALAALQYDPNYNDTGSDDENGMDDDDAGSDDDEGYSDDDDISWKVRRASAKTLSALILQRPEKLSSFYQEITPTLVSRFREREENVRCEIIGVFIDMLKQTELVSAEEEKRTDDNAMECESQAKILLKNEVPRVIKAVSKQLTSKSIKTRVICFTLLRELVQVLPGSIEDHLNVVVPAFKKAFSDRQATPALKVEALGFLGAALAHKPGKAWHGYLEAVAPPVFAAVSDRYYKITAEALRVCTRLVIPIQEVGNQALAMSMFQAAMTKLMAQDQDQEVKEAVIICSGNMVAHLGNILQTELSGLLSLLLERLKNEITRFTVVKALTTIASSPLRVNLSSVMKETIEWLASFLRKSHRPLVQASLTCLEALVRNYSTFITVDMYREILNNLTSLVSDQDLHLAHAALIVATLILEAQPAMAQDVKTTILPQGMVLVTSPVLQGQALQSLSAFFAQLVRLNVPTITSAELLSSLAAAPSKVDKPSRQVYNSVAQCIGTLTLNLPKASQDDTVAVFLRNITAADSSDSTKLLSLTSLGEIGRHINLSHHAQIRETVSALLDAGSEEIKSAASFALGNITVGALEQFLPALFVDIVEKPNRQYLLLHALKEVITRHSSQESARVLGAYVDKMFGVLFKYCDAEDEGVRNVVAECLGRLVLLDVNFVLPALRERLQSPTPHTRWAMVTALRFALTFKNPVLSEAVSAYIGDFFKSIQDSDLTVRRASLLLLNCTGHNHPQLARAHLSYLMPALFEEMRVKPELIRTVDLGPFKHKVDDGLEIRKAAFETLDTLLDSCPQAVAEYSFLPHVKNGLLDHHDIKLLSYLVLIKAASTPAITPWMLPMLDDLVDPLREIIVAKPKENAVKHEIERFEEQSRSAVRVVAALNKIEGASESPRFHDLIENTIKQDPELKVYYMQQSEASRVSSDE